MQDCTVPSAIILINGKRKCGKDYFASKLADQLGNSCQILHLSIEIKREYGQIHNLDFELLLTDSPYKDEHRKGMIALGESRRNADPAHYCRLAAQQASAPVWIIVDNRRVSDMEYFKSNYPGKCLVVRVAASEDIRKGRGWFWRSGVDDVVSECGLDEYVPDVLVVNNRNESDGFTDNLKKVALWISERSK